MKKALMVAALATGFTLAQGAVADSNVALGVYGGTTGLGVGANFNYSDNLQFRVLANRLDYDYDATVDDYEYDLNLKMNSLEALVDYFPFNGGFRLTGGVMLNSNDFAGRGRPRGTGQVEFGDQLFAVDDIGHVDAKVEVNRMVPYLGLGYGNAFRGSNLSFSADAGVFFMGRPDVTVRATAANPLVQDALSEAAKQEEKELRDEVKRVRYYPLLRVGLTYAF